MKEVSETSPVAATSEYHEMDVRLVQVEAILPTLATKSDVAELRADMHKMEVSIVRWTVVTIVGMFLGFSGMFFAMQNNTNSRIASLENMVLQQHGLLIPAPAVDSSASERQQ